MSDVLKQLSAILEQRKLSGEPDTSYVARLHHQGLNKILQKVGEECTETMIAAKDAQVNGDATELVYETADLWFHTLVMLSHLGEDADSILNELSRRFDLSGLEEKASRDNSRDK